MMSHYLNFGVRGWCPDLSLNFSLLGVFFLLVKPLTIGNTETRKKTLLQLPLSFSFFLSFHKHRTHIRTQSCPGMFFVFSSLFVVFCLPVCLGVNIFIAIILSFCQVLLCEVLSCSCFTVSKDRSAIQINTRYLKKNCTEKPAKLQ